MVKRIVVLDEGLDKKNMLTTACCPGMIAQGRA